MQQDRIRNLKKGEQIIVPGSNSQPVVFKANMGDALLRGETSQVWLENDDNGKRLYLRRLPEPGMSIGPALFTSLDDLAQTLETGNYYIG
ncbi:MAG: hypothetical protein ABIK68_07765 [bacterium]